MLVLAVKFCYLWILNGPSWNQIQTMKNFLCFVSNIHNISFLPVLLYFNWTAHTVTLLIIMKYWGLLLLWDATLCRSLLDFWPLYGKSLKSHRIRCSTLLLFLTVSGCILIIIIYLSCSWATCWPVPGSRIQKSLQRSAMIPSASWRIVFHYPG
jgi:hypothetical protein